MNGDHIWRRGTPSHPSHIGIEWIPDLVNMNNVCRTTRQVLNAAEEAAPNAQWVNFGDRHQMSPIHPGQHAPLNVQQVGMGPRAYDRYVMPRARLRRS
jgi:hypothetical protein